MDILDYLLDAFAGPGAPFMWILTAVLALSVTVLVERVWSLWLTWRWDPAAVRAALARGADDEALHAAGRGPLGDVLRAGLEADGPDAAWDAMGAAMAEAEERVGARVPYLAAIGNVATMLGLLGTVYGLIIAFSALGDTGAGERAVRLSEGISTAMATTAYGLLVGIPSLAAHAWLDARARHLLAAIEATAGRLAARLRR